MASSLSWRPWFEQLRTHVVLSADAVLMAAREGLDSGATATVLAERLERMAKAGAFLHQRCPQWRALLSWLDVAGWTLAEQQAVAEAIELGRWHALYGLHSPQCKDACRAAVDAVGRLARERLQTNNNEPGGTGHE